MPDLRRDPIVGRWVIISTERNARPHDFIPLQAARPVGRNPLPILSRARTTDAERNHGLPAAAGGAQ